MAENHLKAWRESRGLTLEQVGTALNSDKTHMSKLEKGQRKLTTDWLERFARFYRVSVAAMLAPPPAAGTEPVEPSHLTRDTPEVPNVGAWPVDVPIMGVSVGGNGGDFSINMGEQIGTARRPPSLTRKVFALFVQGASMSRWREPGGLVFLDPGRPAKPGDRVVVELHPETDGEGHPAYLKELVARTPTKLRLKQYNPEAIIEVQLSRVRNIYRVMEWEEVVGI